MSTSKMEHENGRKFEMIRYHQSTKGKEEKRKIKFWRDLKERNDYEKQKINGIIFNSSISFYSL